MSIAELLIPGIAVLSVALILIRPFGTPEFVWALAGAALLVLVGALTPAAVLTAIGKGADVYCFLTGMMLLAELARQQGVFDYLADHAARQAGGSPGRLFLIVYAVGTLVTIFLSNDATAVVLTPAVYAVTRAAKVNPLPYLYICAFIANAASFVLPISNPANLVVYGAQMPPLLVWLAHFALPSLVAIVCTLAALWLTQRGELGKVAARPAATELSPGGRLALGGIAATAVVLLAASALGWPLGLPTLVAGLLTAAHVLAVGRATPWSLLRGVSWGVLPLVAGLFVLVEGLSHTGILAALTALLADGHGLTTDATAVLSGIGVALGSNVINNLPAGLIVATIGHAAAVPAQTMEALLVGVDLGPNLSITGSLATILWLTALRREGIRVSGREFLRLGVLVMPPALVLALLTLAFEPR